MHIRITRKYHYTPIRMAKYTVIPPNADEATGELGPSHIVGGNVKVYSQSGK